MAACAEEKQSVCESEEGAVFTKSSEDLGEIPKDFEPGASTESVLLSTPSYEDEENNPNLEFNNYHRKGSCISEIENDVSKLQIQESIPENETVTKPGSKESGQESSVLEIEEIADDYKIDDDADSQVNNPVWRQQKKHIFVLSEAGKPIYSRHGSEDKLVTLMGVMQALLSFVQQSGDSIRSIHACDHNFVFLHRIPLILVAVSMTKASVPQLIVHLNYVYNHVVSVLTLSNLNRIFEQRRNYDLRRLLGGSEKFLDNLVDSMDRDPGCLLNAVRCLSLDSSIRDIIGQMIVQPCSKVKNIVFAILLAQNQLVTLVRMKKYPLHSADLHLIMNLVSSSESLKSSETWIPICLPRFDARGFLHGHISYLDDTNCSCLLLLTVDKDYFFHLQKCRTQILERLNKYNCLEAISKSLKHNGYTVTDVGIPEVRHFLYKSRSTAQFTSPRLCPPYITADDWEHLFGLYQYLHHRMYRSSRPLKMLYFSGERETMVGWHMQGFELYAAFEPLVTKSDATTAMKKIVHWIKKEEENLFIMNAPTM